MTFNHWVQGSSPCVPTRKIQRSRQRPFNFSGHRDVNHILFYLCFFVHNWLFKLLNFIVVYCFRISGFSFAMRIISCGYAATPLPSMHGVRVLKFLSWKISSSKYRCIESPSNRTLVASPCICIIIVIIGMRAICGPNTCDIFTFCDLPATALFTRRVNSAAKSLPCVFNNFVVFYRGAFQTVNLLTADALARILSE